MAPYRLTNHPYCAEVVCSPFQHPGIQPKAKKIYRVTFHSYSMGWKESRKQLYPAFDHRKKYIETSEFKEIFYEHYSNDTLLNNFALITA